MGGGRAGGILDVDHGDVGAGGAEGGFEVQLLELEVGVVVVDFEIGRGELAAEEGGVFGQVEGGADVGFDGDGDLVLFGEASPGGEAFGELGFEFFPFGGEAADHGFDDGVADFGGEFQGGFEAGEVLGGVAGEAEILHDGDDGEVVFFGEGADFGGAGFDGGEEFDAGVAELGGEFKRFGEGPVGVAFGAEGEGAGGVGGGEGGEEGAAGHGAALLYCSLLSDVNWRNCETEPLRAEFV